MHKTRRPARVARAVAVVGALASALVLAGCSSGSEAEPTVSGAALPDPDSTVSPSPGSEHAIVTGDDVEILARLESPTTGETWHEPTAIANPGLLAYPDYGIADDFQYFSIGTHGDSEIVAAVPAYYDYLFGGYSVYAVFEVTASTARLIDCPSARFGDKCMDWGEDWESPGRSIDQDTHYDSLTFPVEVQPLPGWKLDTAHLHEADWVDPRLAYGDANGFPGIALTPEEEALLGREGRKVLAELGDSALVEFRVPGVVPGLIASRLAIETPYGGVIPSESAFVAPWYGLDAVTWDDGAVTFMHESPFSGEIEPTPVTPARETCGGPDETLADEFAKDEWVAAGKHRLGGTVYLPKSGGNDLARAVWETMRDSSWGTDVDPALEYPYSTFDEFLDARSVFAWERPDGEWVVAIDAHAGQRVYECV